MTQTTTADACPIWCAGGHPAGVPHESPLAEITTGHASYAVSVEQDTDRDDEPIITLAVTSAAGWQAAVLDPKTAQWLSETLGQAVAVTADHPPTAPVPQ